MKDIKDYTEYKSLFEDDLVVAVRNLLTKIEDRTNRVEDGKEHNEIKTYFNKFALHKKLTEEEFNNWK